MNDKFRQDVERARRMTPEERIREGFALFEHGRDYIVKTIRTTLPDATEEDVRRIRDVVIRRCKMWGIT